MLKTQKIENTMFFVSEFNGIPYGYIVLSLRKRKLDHPDYAIKQAYALACKRYDRAKCLKINPGMLYDSCKGAVYSNRHDFTRNTESVIHPISEQVPVDLDTAWSLVFNGMGHSAKTGKPLKYIICKEKRRKAGIKAIELIDRSLS